MTGGFSAAGRSRPLLDGFYAWLETETPKLLPKSAARGAMDYTLSNWIALSVYPDDGWLNIDNNAAENALRGICLGRGNWIFGNAGPSHSRRSSIPALQSQQQVVVPTLSREEIMAIVR